MSDTVVTVENLSKRYIIRHNNGQNDGLRHVLQEAALAPWRWLRTKRNISSSDSTGSFTSGREEFWALRDVSLEIKKGEVVGIIGRNGAGKSTLLKILSRITEPTRGRIRLRGRVASLLEVGTGFHPELTGRENIFLNGAILGMARAEIKQKFDEIVSFAEVEQFLDTPVKRYSSGMYVRLAFAVAAHLEPEILFVDEVLAVGDVAFQKRCMGKMQDVSRQQGRTIFFVSHNMHAIRTLCPRVLVFDRGALVLDADAQTCIQHYSARSLERLGATWVRPMHLLRGHLSFESAFVSIEGSQPELTLRVVVRLRSNASHKPAFVAIDVLDPSGAAIMQAIPVSKPFLHFSKQEHDVCVRVKLPPLIPGSYSLTLWVGSHHTETLDQVASCIVFEVADSPHPDRTFPHHADHGYVVPESCLENGNERHRLKTVFYQTHKGEVNDTDAFTCRGSAD